MGTPRVVAVVGFKNAGKTRVVEALVAELTRRGHRVGTLKHTAEDAPFDKPGTDTWRHAEAGAVASAILSEKRTAIFLKRALSIQRAAGALGDVDFIVLEGFKTLDIAPRIIVSRNSAEIDELKTGIEIAVVDISRSTEYAGVLTFDRIEDGAKLADLVEAQAYPLLAGLNCKACGYTSCKEMGKAILEGRTTADKCVNYSSGVSLKVDGSIVALNNFVQLTLVNVILGFLKTLKGVEEPHRVELDFEVKDDA